MPARPSTNKCDKHNSMVNRHIGTAYDNVKIVADNIETIEEIGESLPYLLKYLGAYSNPPTERPDGTTLQNGDYYFDSASEFLTYYNLNTSTWFVVDPQEILDARDQAIAAGDAAQLAQVNAEFAETSASQSANTATQQADRSEAEANRSEQAALASANSIVARGVWDASLGDFPTPTLTPLEKADWYRISVAGTMSDNNPLQPDVSVEAQDNLYWDPVKDIWYAIRNLDLVRSVDGQQGDVAVDKYTRSEVDSLIGGLKDLGAVSTGNFTEVKHRRGTQAEVEGFTPALAELIMITDTDELVLGNGVTQGGKRVSPKETDTVSIMKTRSYKPGDRVFTKGYSAAGDGGAGEYLILPIPAVADGNIDHALNNGNVASLQIRHGILKAEQAGIVGDWDGSAGTDETVKLQAAIDWFNNQTGELDISTLNIRADSARVDFKLVSIKGSKAPVAGYTSGASIYVGSSGGLYTSIETNTAPELAYLKVFSADERIENGQTVVDLTGLNYPRMNNVLIYGGENGLKLQKGAVVESHYGNFYSVDISRSYNGVMVLGGNKTQTHSFYGGRIWDCVESYVNAEGTSDINFYGTAFEGDRSAQHLDAGSDPDAAETNFFGCRDECDSDPDIQVGSIKQIGTYWSGNKKPATQTITATELTEKPNQVMIQGVRDDLVPVGYNVLKNPNFEPDLADSSVIAGWEVISANLHAIEKGPFGNVAHIRGVDATQRTALLRQSGIKVKKGWYTWGVAYERVGTTGTLTTRLDDNGTLLVEGVDFEGVAINTTAAGGRIHRIKFLRDIDSLRYEVRVSAVGDGDDLYMSYPFLVQGRNSDKHQSYNKAPVQEGYASAVPTSGFHTTGDKVYNLAPTEIGVAPSKYVVTGWIRLTTGTNNVLNTDWVEMRTLTGN